MRHLVKKLLSSVMWIITAILLFSIVAGVYWLLDYPCPDGIIWSIGVCIVLAVYPLLIIMATLILTVACFCMLMAITFQDFPSGLIEFYLHEIR